MMNDERLFPTGETQAGMMNQETMIGPFRLNSIAHGHALELSRRLPDNSIDAIITSPPYFGLRDYGLPPAHWSAVTFAPMAGLPEITIPEQEASLGLEADLWAYVGHLVALFRELRRALKGTGSCWLNLGDSYAANRGYQVSPTKWQALDFAGSNSGKVPAGLKPKDLMLIPHRVALALQADGWYLRSDIPWLKRNGMPGSQQDRPTVAKEYWFLLSKSPKYYFDLESIKMPTADSSKARLAQDVANQVGTTRANGGAKTNGNLKAVGDPDLRARRDSDWFFDSLRAILDDNAQILLTSEDGDPLALTVNPVGYKAAHFATFPAALVTPLVLASTSERGVCPECGKPWVRVVEKKTAETTRPRPFAHSGNDDRNDTGRIYEESVSITTGWQPTCAHGDLEPTPAVILDPFIGSGTVAREAARNRRCYLGFELNEDYLGLAEDRATVQVEMF
jgi:DNA modification methylase